MILYPYTSPIILTDEIFSDYGGHTDNTTDKQRKAAYWLAEQKLSEDLETYLLPTIVTGTYLFRPTEKFLTLDHTYVSRILVTRFYDTEEYNYWSQAGTDNVYISLRDDERGLVDIHWLLGRCNCTSHAAFPYKIQEVYECGLPSGTSFRDDILLGLTTYADIILNEIIGYGNESPGDIGIQSFSNAGYTEERVKLIQTTFGSSPRAHFVRELTKGHRRLRWVGML